MKKTAYIYITCLILVIIVGSGTVWGKDAISGTSGQVGGKAYTGKKISINVTNANIRDILKKLEPICGKKFIVETDVNTKVTLKLTRTPCDQVVEILLSMNQLKALEDGNTVIVYPSNNLPGDIGKKEAPKVVRPERKVTKVEKKQTEKPEKPVQKHEKVESVKNRYYVGLFGAYALQNLDEQQTKDKFIGDIDISFDDSAGIQIRGGYVLNRNLVVEAMFEYVSPFKATLDNGEDELNVMGLWVSGIGVFPVFENVSIYGVLGGGILDAYEDISYYDISSTTSDLGFAFRFGLGVDLYATPDISIGIEAVNVSGTGGVSHIQYMTLSAGVSYHF